MDINKTGLNVCFFDEYANTNDRVYAYMGNLDTHVSRLSKTYVDYFGLPNEYMVDFEKYWINKIHPDDRKLFKENIEAIIENRSGSHILTYRALNKNNEYVVCSCHGNVVFNNGVRYFVGTIENHSYLDDVDSLTGLGNIRGLKNFIVDALRNDDKLSIVQFTITNFYEIDELYGYEFGDTVLKRIGEFLISHNDDNKFSFKGDGVNFYLAFINTPDEVIINGYKNFRETLKNGFMVDDVVVMLNPCAGALLDAKYLQVSTILGALKSVVSRAKEIRSTKLIVFDPKVGEQNRNNIEVLQILRHDIMAGCKNFYLVYQPIMDAKDETIIGCEALLRYNSEKTGFLSPGIFIPWLEMDPAYNELGIWVIKEALKQTKELLNKKPDFFVNINITYSQLSNPDFIDIVKDIINEVDFPAQNICLELTERCRQLEINYLKSQVQKLRDLNVRVAIDDFGTGTSSLNLLSDVPVNELKIDHSFIRDINSNYNNKTIVKAICMCANDLNLDICAEGLETRELIDFVKQFNITCYQGYYFSKPIELSEFKERYFN